MNNSENLKNNARHLEGLPGGKPALKAYPDQGRPPTWTQGYGHTEGITEHSPDATPEQCETWLDGDLTIASNGVDDVIKVPLNQNQHDALTLFVLNEGTEALRTSTLARLLNQGRYDAVPAQLDRWDKVKEDGKLVVSHGLQARRATEKALWLTPSDAPAGVASSAHAQTHDTGSATPPPAPTNVTQTSTGRNSIAVVVSGITGTIIDAINSVKPASDAVHSANDMMSGSHMLSIIVGACLIGSVGFALWTLIERHAKFKETGQ